MAYFLAVGSFLFFGVGASLFGASNESQIFIGIGAACIGGAIGNWLSRPKVTTINVKRIDVRMRNSD